MYQVINDLLLLLSLFICSFNYNVIICKLILKLIIITQTHINLELNQTHNSHSLK